MAYLKYLRPAVLITLVVLFIFVIHPFTRDAVVVTAADNPASLAIRQNDIISSINGMPINTIADYNAAIEKISPDDSVSIIFLRETFPYNYKEFSHMFVAQEKDNKTFIGLQVDMTKFSNIKMGYKLFGGSKFVINSDQSNAVSILKNRFDINYVNDYEISKQDSSIIIKTTAGDEIIPLIETNGKFEARIGDEIFFTTEDIKNVCINGINCNLKLYAYQDQNRTESKVLWKYGFQVTLDKEAGERFVELTKDLSISSCQYDRCLLNSTIGYYIDGELIGSEEIYAENKGMPYEMPIIGGHELTKEDATKSMAFTQSILKGELDAEITAVESMPAEYPGLFNIAVYIMIGLIIAGAIASFVLVKKIKLFLAMIVFGLSEIIIVIGSLTGLNIVFSILTTFSLIAIGVISFVFTVSIVKKLKKDGFIRSKVAELSKKTNNKLMMVIAVLFILVFIVPAFFSSILIYVILVLLLTKSMLFKSI